MYAWVWYGMATIPYHTILWRGVAAPLKKSLGRPRRPPPPAFRGRRGQGVANIAIPYHTIPWKSGNIPYKVYFGYCISCNTHLCYLHSKYIPFNANQWVKYSFGEFPKESRDLFLLTLSKWRTSGLAPLRCNSARLDTCAFCRFWLAKTCSNNLCKHFILEPEPAIDPFSQWQ